LIAAIEQPVPHSANPYVIGGQRIDGGAKITPACAPVDAGAIHAGVGEKHASLDFHGQEFA
jgi:hypothetical protein